MATSETKKVINAKYNDSDKIIDMSSDNISDDADDIKLKPLKKDFLGNFLEQFKQITPEKRKNLLQNLAQLNAINPSNKSFSQISEPTYRALHEKFKLKQTQQKTKRKAKLTKKQKEEQEKKEQAERHLTAAVDEAIRVAKYEVASELQKDINSYALEKKFREMQLIAEQLVPFIDRAILSETAYGEEKKRPMFKKSVKVTPEQLSAIIQLNKGNRVDEVPYDVYQSNHDALHFSRERVDTVRTDLLQRSDRDVSGLIPLPRKLTELIPTQASVRSKAMGAIDPSRGGYWAPNDRKVAQEAVDARLADKMSELQSEVSQQIRATMEQFVSDLQAKRAEIASVVSSGQERINTHVAEHPDSILKGARVVDIVSSLDRHIERAQSVLKGL
ncbi:MAG TPA: hypothetical protein DEP63_00305 [Candidatus Magasanikbacteria bacterium]|nr:hypothetical protein [Candidatus Magasanikbacteria bacterium]